MGRRKRHDPPSTAADGFRHLDKITGADPSRWYCFTNPNDSSTGTAAYLMREGARVELKTPDGPRLVAGDGVKEGDAITREGQILVSWPKEVRSAEVSEWQATANAFDKKVLRDGNVEDPMRGRYSWGSNKVNPTETEWAMPRGA